MVAKLVFLVFLCVRINANIDEISFDLLNDKLFQFSTADPSWPRQCAAPNCNVVNRSLRYPSTIARQFFQCQFINNIWNAMIVNCPCDQLFDYMVQGCVRFDGVRIEWCTNSIDSNPISCGTPGPATTTTTGLPTTPLETTSTTTTTMVPETTTPVPTTLSAGTTIWSPPGGTPTTPTGAPPGDTTTTGRYTTVTWS